MKINMIDKDKASFLEICLLSQICIEIEHLQIKYKDSPDRLKIEREILKQKLPINFSYLFPSTSQHVLSY